LRDEGRLRGAAEVALLSQRDEVKQPAQGGQVQGSHGARGV
jgi:hypothetical protein